LLEAVRYEDGNLHALKLAFDHGKCPFISGPSR
jgi:hypothetical protein